MNRLLAVACTALAATLPAGASLAAPPGDPVRGREVYERNCSMCHGPNAAGMMGVHPSLRGAVQRLSRLGVEVTIRKGRAVTPPMPAFGKRLTDRQIADVIAYLETLPPGPRNFGPRAGGRSPPPGPAPWLPWLVVALAIVLVGGAGLLASRVVRVPRSERALALLEERYARGEIDDEEFTRRRDVLRRSRGGPGALDG